MKTYLLALAGLVATAVLAQSPEWQKLTDESIAFYKQGQFDKAAAPAQQALDLALKQNGENHPATAMSLNNLAVLNRTLGKYPEAEAFALRALAIREKAPGASNADLAATLDNVAMLYDAQSQFEKAEPYYRRALELREKASGP